MRKPELSEILVGMPEERMSSPSKRFAEALYRENLASLSHLIRTMMT